MTELFRRLPTKRECGECDLCCTAVGVASMSKPPAVPCAALHGEPGHSCAIYPWRPRECAEFLCLWRCSDTLLPQNLYPARAGFVVAMSGHLNTFPPILTVHPDPGRPDAWRATHHRPLFRELARKFNAIVCIYQMPLTVLAISPRGNEYSRDRWPGLFKESGTVGLPDFEFLPFRLTPRDITILLFQPMK